MTWLLTAAGDVHQLLAPTDEAIRIGTIATALSRICRYCGHTRRHYSVAEHSLHVVTIMEREWGVQQPAGLMAGLLHDAHEAFCGDMPTPVKQALHLVAPGAWASIEDAQARAVQHRFALRSAAVGHARAIHAADKLALAAERRDLLPPSGPAWEALAGVQAPDWLDLRDDGGLSQDDWRELFLERFAELQYGRDELAARHLHPQDGDAHG